jgi:ABC-2 type transport system permease protein
MQSLLLSWLRLRSLLGKEFLQLLRDPRMRFFVLVPPIVQLIIFGYAATFDVKSAQVGVLDYSRSKVSRDLLADVTATGHFDLHYLDNMSQAQQLMNRNEVRAIVQFPRDFDRSGVVQLIADGSDSNSALLVVGQFSQALRHSALDTEHIAPPIEIEYRAWFNPNLEDREFFVPGIIANVLLISTMILTAMTVVREREIGTLERLMVTPLARFEFIFGKIVPVACVGLFDVILVSTVAVVWFGIPFRGSIVEMFFGTTLYLLSTLGLGLLVSSFSSTQQQAMLWAVFLIMPLVILSGFAFPIRNMPESVQLVTWLDPLRYYLVVIRDSFLKGGHFGDHWFQFTAMALLGLTALSVSAWRIR